MDVHGSDLWSREQGEQLIERARETNARRDTDEHAHGMATPADLGPLETVRVARLSIMIGLGTGDLDCFSLGIRPPGRHRQALSIPPDVR
jgi:hypothetical protein